MAKPNILEMQNRANVNATKTKEEASLGLPRDTVLPKTAP